MYVYIYLSIVFISCSLQKYPPRKWPQQKSLHLFSSCLSLIVCSSLPFYQHLSHSFTPLSYPSIFEVASICCCDPHFHSDTIHFFTDPSLFALSKWLKHLKYIFCRLCHHSLLHLHKFLCHIFHACFHCPHPPHLSLHILPSNNSF